MEDAKDKTLPGTAPTFTERGEKGFAKIEMLLEATGGLSLSQVCAVTGLEGSTIQNWVKRGWVAHPSGKRYEETHIARILIINALKECIKLEHIALLMSYINGTPLCTEEDILKESDLYNFLCDALDRMGKAGDQSNGGVDSVVETVIKGYKGTKPECRARIRKALSLMIYACVCTDVKRRTETMMGQILYELIHPESIIPVVPESVVPVQLEEVPAEEIDSIEVPRKTVSQALREWDANDISRVERVIIDYTEENTEKPTPATEEKHSYRPWYSRKNPKH